MKDQGQRRWIRPVGGEGHQTVLVEETEAQPAPQGHMELGQMENPGGFLAGGTARAKAGGQRMG